MDSHQMWTILATTIDTTPTQIHCCLLSVAYFILEVGGGILKLNLKYFKTFLMFFNWNSLKTSIREVLYGKSLSRTFPSSKMYSSSSSPPKYWSKITPRSPPMQNSSSTMPSSFSVQGSGLKAQALSLNVLMLYGNMEQLMNCTCLYSPYWPRLM